MRHGLQPPSLFALFGASLWLTSCGGAAAPQPQSTHAPAPRVTELDALEHDFEVSAQQLSAQLRRRQIGAGAAASTTTPNQTPAAEAKPQREPLDEGDGPKKKKEEGAGAPPPAEQRAADERTPAGDYAAIGSPCDLMCRAFSSMQRSAGGICSLAGEEHERCRRARVRLELAEGQVAQAGCACVAAP